MPNWCENTLEIISDDISLIQECLNQIKSEEEIFDFNKIIPMPEDLNIESSNIGDISHAVYAYKNGDKSILDEYLKYDWVKNLKIDSVDVLYDHILKEKIYNEELGKRIYNNLINYGCKSWYEWCYKNWGTKWNACRAELIDNNTIYFETAWAPPLPVIKKLSEMFPKIVFRLKYEEFGMDFAGIIDYVGGVEKDIMEYSPSERFKEKGDENENNYVEEVL